MPKLFSYVVDHDLGFAPNPFGGFCTLAKCKYGTIKCNNGTMKRNIVEMAEEGDWIAGTGGADVTKSAGHRKLLYAMRVDEKIPLEEYCHGNKGNRIDAEHEDDEDGRFALMSYHFFYFGPEKAGDIQGFWSEGQEGRGRRPGPGKKAGDIQGFWSEGQEGRRRPGTFRVSGAKALLLFGQSVFNLFIFQRGSSKAKLGRSIVPNHLGD